jgi:hypothetical protein
MAIGCLINMLKPEWKPVETLQKLIRVTRVEAKEHHLDAVELDGNIPMCLSVVAKIDLGKVKRAKIYKATVTVYETEFTPELEQQVFESAMNDPTRYKALQSMKAQGLKPRKYEITSLKH